MKTINQWCPFLMLFLSLTAAGRGHADRLWQSGFETKDAVAGETEFAHSGSLSHMSFDGISHGGSFSGLFNGSGFIEGTSSFFSTNRAYARLYLTVGRFPTVSTLVCSLVDTADTPVASVALNPSGTLSLLDGSGVVLGTGTTPIALGTWNRIEAAALTDQGSGQLRLNGVDQFAPVTVAAWLPYRLIDRMKVGVIAGETTYPARFDDLALNSADGTVQNTWPGPGQEVLLNPAGDLGPNQWLGSGAGTHAALLADLPGAPNAATYLQSQSSGLGIVDHWGFQPTPAAIQASDAVNAVFVGVRGGTSVHSGASTNFAFAETGGAAGTSVYSNWSGFRALTYYPMVATTLTLSGMPLTKAYIDNLGAEAQTAVDGIKLMTVWETVDYTGSASGP